MTAVVSREAALFASTTKSFLDKQASLADLRSWHESGVSVDRRWWQQAAELGWTALLMPDELGGGSPSGDGVADLAAISTLIGHTVAPGPLHPVSIVLTALADAANSNSHAQLIDDLISGRMIASWAVYEPDEEWSSDDPTPNLQATRTSTGFRLDGAKDRVEAGNDSDVFLVVAQCGSSTSQFVVSSHADGITLTPQSSVDLVKGYAHVTFDGVEIDHNAVVGSPEQTPALIERQSQIALLLQCSELVGVIDAVLTMTIQWARDRHTFGRPIGSYQALKHRFADMKTWFEACRAATDQAVADVSARSLDAPRSVSVAKSFVADRACAIIQDCVQMHGGIGVTWEHDLHLYLRRATLYRAMYGSPEYHDRRVFSLMEASQPLR